MRILRIIRSGVTNYWQAILFGLFVLIAGLGLLVFRLDSLLGGVLPQELSFIGTDVSKAAFLDNPVGALFKVPLHALKQLDWGTVLNLRLISAGMAFLTAGLLYYVLRQWYSRLIAVAGFVLIITSSWFLTFGRMASPDMSYALLVMAGIAYGAWSRTTKRSALIILAGLTLGIAYIYTAGLVWIAFAAVIWQRKAILRWIVGAPKMAVFAILVSAILISPLCYAVFRQPGLVKEIAGFSAEPHRDLSNLGIRGVDFIQQLAVNGQTNPALGLTNAALLDLFTGVMTGVGLVSLIRVRKLDRSKIVAGLVVVLGFLISLNGMVPSTALLPIIYLLATSGLAYMLDEWFRVFPRNPLAKWVGLGLVSTAIALTSLYHLQRYYVAWPKAPQTKAVIVKNT